MQSRRSISVAIIGTGFSGLGMAIRLKQKGIEDFALFERAGSVGGTWRDNTYPGCQCDVESHLYSFSFAPNPRWSRMFSPQPEIREYLDDCAARYGLGEHCKFNHDVKEFVWNDEQRLWRLQTTGGTYYARVVVLATGALSEPAIPRLPGIESFKGKVMHSAQWDHDYDLAGRRVAVVGTGASAIQFVPEIQPRVAKLHLFQRTAPWVIPQMDRAITTRERSYFARVPGLQKLARLKIYLQREALGTAFRRPKLMEKAEHLALRHMRRAISDPTLREKLTPSYRIGCKRILLSNSYYPALARENVEVVTEKIAGFRESAIVTHDSSSREIDTLILGTGFRVTEMPIASRVRGRDGQLLAERWKETPRAFLGTAVAGFPNLFFLLGPNTGLGHSSVVMMIESQIAHVMRALRYLRERGDGRAIEPRAQAQDAFNAEIDEDMKKTVWVTGGCASWYLDHTGRNSTLWPGSVGAFRRRVEPFRTADYEVV